MPNKLAIESNMPRRTCQTQHPSCDRCRTIYRAHILALLYYNNVTYFESQVSRNVARCQQQWAITVGLESCRTNTSTNNTIDLDRSFLSFNPKIDLFADINSHCHARPPSTCAARAAYSGQTTEDSSSDVRGSNESKYSNSIKMLLKLFKKFRNAS